MTIVSIGEVLWDVYPDCSHLGGAPFNFAAHAQRLGHRVVLVSAVGNDERGAAALKRAAELGLDTQFIQVAAGMATGHVSVWLDAEGKPDFTIHRPAAYDYLRLDDAQLANIARMQPEWIYFGTLLQMNDNARSQMLRLMQSLPGARRFYDLNLRRGNYTPELVRESIGLAQAVKLNDEEAEQFPDFDGAWAVAVTRGARGCEVRIGDDGAECAGYAVKVVDTVGAGDAFAAGFLHGIARGWSAPRTGEFANRLGALVASRPGAAPDWTLEELEAFKG